jgi:hypothetical protein
MKLRDVQPRSDFEPERLHWNSRSTLPPLARRMKARRTGMGRGMKRKVKYLLSWRVPRWMPLKSGQS